MELVIKLSDDVYTRLFDNGTETNRSDQIEIETAIRRGIPKEPCEDVIDRAEAMTEIMMFAGNVKSDEEGVYIKVSDVVQLLRELPPVTPQPKTGHWIRVTDKAGHLVWECDKCGWQQRFNTNFCPDCGVKMVEPQESESEGV